MTTENHAPELDPNAQAAAEQAPIGAEPQLLANEPEQADGDSDADRLMAAGYEFAKTGKMPDLDNLPTGNEPAGQAAPGGTGTDLAGAQPAPLSAADEAQARLEARFAALEKGTQTTAGHLGYLKQQLMKAQQGKPITKESLTHMREEFGDDYAEAVAKDLNALGLGGALPISQDEIEQRIQEQVQARSMELERKVEKKLVKRDHPDADEFFHGGQHNAAFAGWVQTLPQNRQQEIGTSWDSETVGSYLSEFKALRAKASTRQARQESRIERAVAPTTGAGAHVAPPAVDPLLQGWMNVRGNKSGSMHSR